MKKNLQLVSYRVLCLSVLMFLSIAASLAANKNGTNKAIVGLGRIKGGLSTPAAPTPTITAAGTTLNMTMCSGGALSRPSFTVSASGLTATYVVVTADAGFGVATSTAGNFVSSLSLATTVGGLAATSIYVKANDGSTSGTTGNVTCSAVGATSKVVPLAVTVYYLPSFSVNPSTTAASYCASSTGQSALSVTFLPGSGNQSSFRWYSNTANSNTGGTTAGSPIPLSGATGVTQSFTPTTSTVGANYYYGIATNSYGCTSASGLSGLITINPKPIVVTHDMNLCTSRMADLTDASRTEGSTANLTFTYSTNSLFTSTIPNPPLVGPGSYYIRGTDNNSCSSTSRISIINSSSPALVSQNIVNNVCTDDAKGSVQLNMSTQSGTLPFTYVWTKTEDANFTASTQNISNLTSGNYNILITDAIGCTASASLPVKSVDLVLPDDKELETVTGQCSAIVVIPTTTDNCDGVVVGMLTNFDPGVSYYNNDNNLTFFQEGTYDLYWSFVDNSGNERIIHQTVIIHDTEAPVSYTTISGIALPTLTGDCSVTVSDIPTANDDCEGYILATTEDPLYYDFPGTYTIHWTYADSKGNTSYDEQTVIIDDKTGAIPRPIPDLVVECGVDYSTASPLADDACSGVVAGTTTDPLVYSTQGNFVVNWVFDDGHGNLSYATQNIIVKDSTAPNVPVLADLVGECSVTVPTATTTDNCTQTLHGTTSDPLLYTEQGTNATIHWTFDDGHGNIVTAEQKVIVKDVSAPVVPTLEDVRAQCSVTVSAPTAVDNCVGDVTGTTSDPLTYIEQGVYTIHWSFTDGHGNTSTGTQKVTVLDDTKPTITAPADVAVTTNTDCTATGVDLGTPVTADNCIVASVSNDHTSTTYTLGVTTVTWTVTDGVGNTATVTQKVTVTDNVKPTITAPADFTVNTNSDCSATDVVLGTPVTADNCSVATVVNDHESTTYPLGETTVTWTVTDGSGNTATATQKVTVTDNKAPVIVCPADINVFASSADGAVVNYTDPKATDNCTLVSNVRTAGLASESTFPIGTTVVTYTATDAAGLTTSCSFNVIVAGLPPVINCPSNIVTNSTAGVCGANVTFAATETTANPVSTITYSINPGSLFPVGTTTVTAIATNSVGSSTCSFTVTVNDNEKPTITAPANINVNNDAGKCGAVVASLGTPVVADNCGIASTRNDHSSSSYPVGVTNVTWKVTDVHGNTATAIQTVTVTDNQAPIPLVANLPTVKGQCSATVNAVSHEANDDHHDANDDDENDIRNSAPMAMDNCAGLIKGTTTDPLTYTVQGTYIIHWTFNDGHSNITTQNQTVIVKDDVAPIATDKNLPTLKGSCSVIVTTVPTAKDNCVGIVNGTTTSPLTYTAQGTYTIVWTYSDGRGNTSTQTQTVVVDDDIKPVPQVANLPTVTGACSATVTTVPKANDNCKGVITGTTTDPLTYTAQGTYTIHWSYNDGNGNVTSQNQSVIVKDNSAPVPQVSVLPALNGECSVTVTTVPKANDNCKGEVIATTTDPLSYSQQGTYTIRWNYNDGNGNTTTQNQSVVVRDVTAPTITSLSAITLSCGISSDPSITGTPLVNDNCGKPSLTYIDVTSGNIITRTWTARDAAGNKATSTQVITLGIPFTTSVTSVPTNSTYTGGINTNLYLGYGAQSTTLQLGTLSSAGAPYTYAWTGTYTNQLSSTSVASPVFTPVQFGYYTFNVTVTNKYGCTSSCSISICVTDVRVPGSNGTKIYVTHSTVGKNGTTQTLQLLVNQVASHFANTCGSDGHDRPGSSSQSPCNTTIASATTNVNTAKAGETLAASDEDLKVTAMPNPSTTYFTLKIESRYQTPVELRVMDANGRVVDAKSKIGANSTIQIGHNYTSGTYYAELIQGSQRKVVTLIKVRG